MRRENYSKAEQLDNCRLANQVLSFHIGGSSRGRDDDASLTREKARSQGLQSHAVKDGEFTSIPEIDERTAAALSSRGITSLFPIQQHSFYPVYKREDVIARDLTGSGKTLAFCLPITEYLRK